MAEWFKATDLRPVIIDAWVRTPLAAKTNIKIKIKIKIKTKTNKKNDSCKRLQNKESSQHLTFSDNANAIMPLSFHKQRFEPYCAF